MQEEADQQAGAGKYQRAASRQTYQNGHRERTLRTRYGEIVLNKPQLRDMPFQINVFDRDAQTEKRLWKWDH